MFILEKDEELTSDKISTIIQKFETTDKIQLEKYWNYYNGNQSIKQKTYSDTTKPCNKIVTNYCYNIVTNYQGYLTGKPISYSSTKDITDVQGVLNYNDVKAQDNLLLRNALIYGVAYEIAYIDEDAQQRFKVLDSRECIPVYDNTIDNNLMAVIRYYLVDTLDISKGYYIEVYTPDAVVTYRSNNMYCNLNPVSTVFHHYRQVPVVVFQLNDEQQSIFDKVIDLQDAYNNLLSSEIDDFAAFVDAYLVLNGVDADDSDIAKMKENRCLILPDGSTASYLNKNINDTQINNMLDNIDRRIHVIANYPDFSSDSFGTSSGIAMKMKLLGMENQGGSIITYMTKAIQKRIELICTILNIKGGSDVWRDITITFTRNIPEDITGLANMVNSLRGLVSDKTLLAQLPFVADVTEEQKEVQKQKQDNISSYNFGGDSNGLQEEG